MSTAGTDPFESPDPELARWLLQPLVNTGITPEALETLSVTRLAFEAIVKGGNATPAEVIAIAADQTERVQKAWKIVVWRILRIQNGEVTADNIPELTLEEWLLERITDDHLPALVASRDDQIHDFQPVGLWSAERVIAELENKRQLIEIIHDAVTAAGGSGVKKPLLALLKTMALPYANHPAYRDEWRP